MSNYDWKDPQVTPPAEDLPVLVAPTLDGAPFLAYLKNGVWYEYDFDLQCATFGALSAVAAWSPLPDRAQWETLVDLPPDLQDVVVLWRQTDAPVMAFRDGNDWYASRRAVGLAPRRMGPVNWAVGWIAIGAPASGLRGG